MKDTEMKKYILSIDQGTSSSRAIVFDCGGNIVSSAQKEFTQHFPQPGWVEHDPEEIWESVAEVTGRAVRDAGLRNCGAPASAPDFAESFSIAGIGITNQRETAVVWDAETGRPVCNAIVWQDRRCADYCDFLRSEGLTHRIRQKTGLIIDAYFSATKIRWILNNVPGARELAEKGRLRFGTIDSWLVWKLTGGRVHVTDVSNASRTMLFNIRELKWDDELLEIFGIPHSMLPEVRSSSGIYGYASALPGLENVPVCGIAGDQQAALFGQMCTEEGSVKNTYGTGCFLLMNTGNKIIESENNLLTTVAWKIGDRVDYALEGSVFTAGCAVQWLRDGLGIIRSSSEIEALAAGVPDSGGVCFVPALTGLGAPYWDSHAKGAIYGITRGTTAGHIARATLEGIAFQVMDIVRAMERDSGCLLKELKADGGASRNDLLMQFQADILEAGVVRPAVTETTALGAASLAGLACGVWRDIDDLRGRRGAERRFSPSLRCEDVRRLKDGWAEAVRRTLSRPE